jgi:hypothetical protein
MSILSNFGNEKISDILTENIANNEIQNTYADVTLVGGREVPRETVLTNSDD